MTRESHLKSIKALSAEKTALAFEIETAKRFFEACGHAMNYHAEEIRLLDLVYFCQHGKYPC